MGIVTDYPVWFILLCLLTGGLYSIFLYFRVRHDEINPWLNRSMAFLRFLTVSVISFLLLSPLIKKTSEIMEKPLILIASDNSQSIIAGKDSLFYKKEYSLLLDQMVKKLEKNYSVSFNSFGEKVSGEFPPSFNEKETDISDVFTQFLNRYSNRNIGAMILLSDGIFNKGSNIWL